MDALPNSPDRQTRQRFPIARALVRLARRGLANWRERHQLPINFWLHMVGIPPAFLSLPLFVLLPWYVGLSALVIGYFLQYIGHCLEGNDLGEWAGIKRLLGLPYVGVSPRWAPTAPPVNK
jgi:hypothetical protein